MRWGSVAALALAVLAAQPRGAVAAPAARTLPAVPQAHVLLDGKRFLTSRDGTLRIVPGDWTELRRRLRVPTVWRDGTRIRFSRWVGRIDRTGPPSHDLEVAAAFDVDYPVRFRFVDPGGNQVPYERIARVELRGATGTVVSVTGRRLRDPVLLWGSRVVTLHAGPNQKEIYYRLQSVRMRGANVVNQAQQRYVPATERSVDVQLLFFDAHVVVRDALLGFPVGRAVRVRFPDGTRERHPLGAGRAVTIRSLPRGQYELTVEGLGLPISTPVTITRQQTISLEFVTWLDIAVGLLAILAFLVGLPLLGRRIRSRPRRATGGRQEPDQDQSEPMPEAAP
jgi:hypothetical protein